MLLQSRRPPWQPEWDNAPPPPSPPQTAAQTQSDLTRPRPVRGGLTYKPTKDPPTSLWLLFQAPNGNFTGTKSDSASRGSRRLLSVDT